MLCSTPLSLHLPSPWTPLIRRQLMGIPLLKFSNNLDYDIGRVFTGEGIRSSGAMTIANTNQGVLFCCSKTFLSWRSKPENQTIIRSASDCLQCITYNVLPNFIWLLSTWWGRCDGEGVSAGLHTGQNLPWLIRHFIINFSFKIDLGEANLQTNKQTNQKDGNVSAETCLTIQTS